MRAYATVQQFFCHGSYCKLILSLARASCRLSFLPTLLPLCHPFVELAALLPAVSIRCALNNFVQIHASHDAVATVVLHKHHPIALVRA